MKNTFRCALSLAIVLVAHSANAQKKVERPVINLSGATFRPLPMAIASPLFSSSSANRAAAQEIDSTLIQDLQISGLFELLDRNSFLADPSEGSLPSEIKFGRWQDVGAESLVKVTISGGDPVSVEFHLYNTVNGKEELTRRYSSPAAQARRLAHRFADEIFTFYTREPGAFQTRIAFVRKVKGLKQIYVADWDGQHAQAITSTSLNLLPFWSANGQSLAFTGYKSGNAELWSYNLHSQKTSLVYRRNSAIVTGGSFSTDGKHIAFAVSEDDGNSHLWIASQNGKNARRLTDGFGINSSPSFSPTGKELAFVSNRAGNPQIYIVPSAGGAARRLTFQGNYNQTPDWSPRGDVVAFTARDERNAFDIFTVEVATGKIARLTQDQGNNEEPSFSPNGRHIAFVSTRHGKRQLFVMSADGNFQRAMSTEETFTPAWGPFASQK